MQLALALKAVQLLGALSARNQITGYQEGYIMRTTSKLFALLIVSMRFLGAAQTQMQTPFATQNDLGLITPTETLIVSGYDSPNITIALTSPANGSSVSGLFDINIVITSDFSTLNLTLFIEGAIYPSYDQYNISTGAQAISVDSTTQPEGMLNFTLFFEYQAERETYYLLYFVDNDGLNFELSLYSPANGSTLSGVVSIDLNVTHDYGNINLTVLVDGVAQAPYTPSLIGSGDISVLLDTSSFWEGYNNFTFVFEYSMFSIIEYQELYLEYLIDNDGEPITVGHQSPAYGSDVSGVFNLTLLIGSEYDPLNLTLYVEGEIQSDFNKTPIGIREQVIQVNTTGLPEGLLNFTLLFEYNVTGVNAFTSYFVEFVVNNHGPPSLDFIAPAELETISGVADLWLNISTTYGQIFLNISVDGELVPEFNATLIPSGAGNYSLNSSRYENGEHLVTVTVYTAEGEAFTIERTFLFLDHVRLFVSELASYDEISGNQEIKVRIESPYDNATLSLYVDGVLASDVSNITLDVGLNRIYFNTTHFAEGEHNFTFKAYDSFGHKHSYKIVLVIDNYGPPTLRFATTADVQVGLAEFTIDVDTNWDTLDVSIYVDDVIVGDYLNLTVDVSDGSFTFYIDVSNYTKAEHVIRVVMFTAEGESTEIERVFGFASLRIEEIASMLILLGLTVIIPLYRRKDGHRIRPVIILDIVFIGVVIGAFLVLGISSLPFILWHVNLASIWAIGSSLVFANWALPFIIMDEEEGKS
ncbi:MAG: hypothetical protein AM325_016335 [Candidatus Thorarchaeota archaeon SMTZ1-45]